MTLHSLRPWVALFLIWFAGAYVFTIHHHLVTFREAQKATERAQPKEESPPSHNQGGSR